MSKCFFIVALKVFIHYNLCFKCETTKRVLSCLFQLDTGSTEFTTLGRKFYEDISLLRID